LWGSHTNVDTDIDAADDIHNSADDNAADDNAADVDTYSHNAAADNSADINAADDNAGRHHRTHGEFHPPG
jgi:hypothetical protein